MLVYPRCSRPRTCPPTPLGRLPTARPRRASCKQQSPSDAATAEATVALPPAVEGGFADPPATTKKGTGAGRTLRPCVLLELPVAGPPPAARGKASIQTNALLRAALLRSAPQAPSHVQRASAVATSAGGLSLREAEECNIALNGSLPTAPRPLRRAAVYTCCNPFVHPLPIDVRALLWRLALEETCDALISRFLPSTPGECRSTGRALSFLRRP
ncbi:Protein of unknown function [Gryllus bimaculatus]|nr:Protein of unknown function [Gryllus bimaculatus]